MQVDQVELWLLNFLGRALHELSVMKPLYILSSLLEMLLALSLRQTVCQPWLRFWCGTNEAIIAEVFVHNCSWQWTLAAKRAD